MPDPTAPPITGRPLRLALISMHTSPIDLPGSGDAGGMNVVERHQAEALAAIGHDVELITRRTDPDSPDLVDLVPGRPGHTGRLRLRRVVAGPTTPLSKSAQDPLTGEFCEHLAELEPYDLVHSHHWMSGVAALPVARTWGVPHVQSFHSVAAPPHTPLDHGERPESAGRLAGEALIAQQSDLIVAISRYEARTAVDRCGADPARVVVVPPGVDHELFHPRVPGEPDALGLGRYALFAARLQPLKAPDLAIAAIAKVPQEVRPALAIAGEPSQDFADYLVELHRLAEADSRPDNVRFLGPLDREQLARVMRGAAVMLVPSYSETFGLVALEAAASGVPVIAADSGGLREAVLDGVTGVVVPDRDVDAWADAITRIVSDPELHGRMAAAAREHALGFDWQQVGARLSEIYQRLVTDHG